MRGLTAITAMFAAVASAATAGPVPARAARTQEPAPPAFVALSDVDPTIIQEIRYATPHNFTGAPVDGYQEPICVLTLPAARALHRVQETLRHKGYTLKVYDCYRPQRAVDRFVRWSRDPNAQAMKKEFYPRVDKAHLLADGYIAARSGHSRGSTMDLTIVPLPVHPTRPYRPGEALAPCYAPRSQRFPDDSVDMGTGFDCFDPLAHTMASRIGRLPHANRMLLANTLERFGFSGLAEEWWHFTYRAEPFPATYFDFPVARSSLRHPPGGPGAAHSPGNG
jgi:D-alanyl-D-alanine dipeptidase